MESKHYVYLFLNADDKILYVGITNSISRRINTQHFSGNGHLSYQCYMQTEKVLYMECPSKTDAEIREKYLINKENPAFNDRMNLKHTIEFTIDSWNWVLFPIEQRQTPWLSTFDNCDLEYAYESYEIRLGHKAKLKTLDVIPCTSTQLCPDHSYLRAVSINNVKWIFLEGLLDHLELMGPEPLNISDVAKYIDNEIFNINDICVVSDKHLITLNIWKHDDYELPDQTVLVKLSSSVRFLKTMARSEFNSKMINDLVNCFEFYDECA